MKYNNNNNIIVVVVVGIILITGDKRNSAYQVFGKRVDLLL